MSEFKFACPVCGQHITADSAASGTQLECPTCFQKIIVPQAPTSADSKFILAASQVGKPRPMPSGTDAPVSQPPVRSKLSLTAIALVVALAAGAGAVVFRKQIFKPARPQAQPKEPATQEVKRSVPSAPSGLANTNWTLDLANVAFPERTAAGRVQGRDFICERATLEGGTLALRQGKGWPPPLGITLVLPGRSTEEWSGQTVEFSPGPPKPSTRVVLRWKDDRQQDGKLDIKGGFALKLTFGQPTNNVMPGRIYICLPDDAKSFAAGTFEAEIRKPKPPRQRQPEAPKGS